MRGMVKHGRGGGALSHTMLPFPHMFKSVLFRPDVQCKKKERYRMRYLGHFQCSH